MCDSYSLRYESGKVSFVEAFDLGTEVSREEARGSGPGIGPNVWPSEDELPHFRRDVYVRFTHVLLSLSLFLFSSFPLIFFCQRA